MARKKRAIFKPASYAMPVSPKTVIVVTDGDGKARRAIELAAKKLGMYVVTCSAGSPTRAHPEDVEREIAEADGELIVVMADDGGQVGEGAGERLIKVLSEHGLLNAVVAAASDTPGVTKIEVKESVTVDGRTTARAVDKAGRKKRSKMLAGDTAEGAAGLHVPVIGIGDPGKVGVDKKGARAMERALREAVVLGKRMRPTPPTQA